MCPLMQSILYVHLCKALYVSSYTKHYKCPLIRSIKCVHMQSIICVLLCEALNASKCKALYVSSYAKHYMCYLMQSILCVLLFSYVSTYAKHFICLCSLIQNITCASVHLSKKLYACMLYAVLEPNLHEYLKDIDELV